jgi:hypothetical protein
MSMAVVLEVRTAAFVLRLAIVMCPPHAAPLDRLERGGQAAREVVGGR